MMNKVELKNSGGKKVPHSNLRVGTNTTISSKKKRRIATLNVWSLGICGKLENNKLEMKRHNIDILGMSKIKWPDQGDFWSGGFRAIFVGNDIR